LGQEVQEQAWPCCVASYLETELHHFSHKTKLSKHAQSKMDILSKLS